MSNVVDSQLIGKIEGTLNSFREHSDKRFDRIEADMEKIRDSLTKTQELSKEEMEFRDERLGKHIGEAIRAFEGFKYGQVETNNGFRKDINELRVWQDRHDASEKILQEEAEKAQENAKNVWWKKAIQDFGTGALKFLLAIISVWFLWSVFEFAVTNGKIVLPTPTVQGQPTQPAPANNLLNGYGK